MRRPVAAALAAAAATLAACSGGHSSPSHAAAPTPKPKPCPLTGSLPVTGQKIDRVALAVKIDNVDDARPQIGLDRADVVVEETVEGGLTRLFAVFQCD